MLGLAKIICSYPFPSCETHARRKKVCISDLEVLDFPENRRTIISKLNEKNLKEKCVKLSDLDRNDINIFICLQPN